jgi:hypothetical protein
LDVTLAGLCAGLSVLGPADAGLADVSPTMRTGVPDAVYVGRYAPDARAAAVQAALGLADRPRLGEPSELTPNQPYASDGARLNFWKPAFVIGTRDGGEAGVNFWGLYDEGHINVVLPAAPQDVRVLDCRFVSSGPLSVKIYAGEGSAPIWSGAVASREGHFILAVPRMDAGHETLVEFWPAPAKAPVGFFGCDVSTLTR